MPEEVLFKNESRMDRGTVARYLRKVADSLEAGKAITLSAGAESVTMEPPGEVSFEVKAEREWSHKGGPGKLSIEFELEWREGAQDDAGEGGELKIE